MQFAVALAIHVIGVTATDITSIDHPCLVVVVKADCLNPFDYLYGFVIPFCGVHKVVWGFGMVPAGSRKAGMELPPSKLHSRPRLLPQKM